MADIRVFETSETLSHGVAEFMAQKTREAIAKHGRFTLALSGGSTVAEPYELYGRQPGIDWSKVFIFWGDDRFVEPDNPYSNYALAKKALLDTQTAIPKQNVFPIPFDARTPEEGAEKYASTLLDFFQLAKDGWPVFDLMQNGMGPDGHTASLFPRLDAVQVEDKLVVASHAGLKPWVDRLTFTLPLINYARCVLMLATGAGKAEILRRVLQEEPDRAALPSSAVNPVAGQRVWMLDTAIAANLSLT